MIPSIHAEAYGRAITYVKNHNILLKEEFGSGQDGIVFSTNRQSAVKSLRYREQFYNERDVYLRLRKKNIGSVLGFNVPRLLQYDDELLVIEMQIVVPPFVLDFAGAYLDRLPPFSRAELVPWEAQKREEFGDKWPRVKSIMSQFRKYGIYLSDVKHGNIVFE